MSKRILVVEDHEENRRILRDLLTSVGYELIEAVTGEEGVAMAETQRPDLILMDIQLPGLDGLVDNVDGRRGRSCSRRPKTAALTDLRTGLWKQEPWQDMEGAS